MLVMPAIEAILEEPHWQQYCKYWRIQSLFWIQFHLLTEPTSLQPHSEVPLGALRRVRELGRGGFGRVIEAWCVFLVKFPEGLGLLEFELVHRSYDT